ncbi:hypothetical protein DSN97_08735 [Deferribacteraceae bacterium V6Fe1]|nr:hypothetical protein DSN97_08735 [Deferribacteraceae bacterium V6Fe1]
MNRIGSFVVFTFLLLSSFLTAAHFLRAQQIVFVIIYVILPFLFFIKNRFSYYLIEMALFFSIVEWVVTVYKIISYRAAHAINYTRFSIILLLVILFVISTMIMIWKSKRD